MRKLRHITVVAVCGGALFATGVALADNPGHPNHGQGTNTVSTSVAPTTTTTPGPNASLPAKAKAYGVYCANQSKTHVAGQQGTPFSQCVTAMAKLASGATDSPKAACATMSKKHVAGQKGTPYSACVTAGAKLKNQH